MSKEQQMAEYVARRLERLTHTLGTSGGKAELAKLRRGIGKTPGELPELWGSFLCNLPTALMGNGTTPSASEWAVYSTLTLFALHQQGHSEPVHREGMRLGCAMRKLVHTEDDEERIVRRLNVIATAADMRAFSHYLRGVIQLLSADGIPLDYVQLAKDLYQYQFSEQTANVRLRWGQDFYRFYETEEN